MFLPGQWYHLENAQSSLITWQGTLICLPRTAGFPSAGFGSESGTIWSRLPLRFYAFNDEKDSKAPRHQPDQGATSNTSTADLFHADTPFDHIKNLEGSILLTWSNTPKRAGENTLRRAQTAFLIGWVEQAPLPRKEVPSILPPYPDGNYHCYNSKYAATIGTVLTSMASFGRIYSYLVCRSNGQNGFELGARPNAAAPGFY